MRHIICLAAAALLPLTQISCKGVDCGAGTIERDGECAPATSDPDNANCGPGTQLGPSGKCEPILPPAECDPGSTEPVLDPETGIITCVGTGTGDCTTPLGGCDMASATTMTVCGRIYDLRDDTEVGMGSADTSPCAAPEATGACGLRIAAFDALMFAANPTGTPPLTAAETYLDHCGRFRFREINPAGAPFIGIGVDDAAGNPDNNKLTGIAFPTATNTAKNNTVVYVQRATTDAMWTTSSGEPTSLAAQGVYVNIYREVGAGNMPFSGSVATGVQVLKGGVQIPNDDYYFSNPETQLRTTVDNGRANTGANGTGLVLNQPGLASYGGTMGPLPGGCSWYISQGGAIPGVVFVQIHPPVGTGCDF